MPQQNQALGDRIQCALLFRREDAVTQYEDGGERCQMEFFKQVCQFSLIHFQVLPLDEIFPGRMGRESLF